MEKKNLSISDYSLKIKSKCESLAFINVAIDDDNKVEVCLRGLGQQYNLFKMSIQTWENISNFADLVSMLIIEENELGEHSASETKTSFDQQAFYSNTGRDRGRGHHCGGQNGGQIENQHQQQQTYDNQQQHTGGRGQFRGRESYKDCGGSRMMDAVVSIVASLSMYRLIATRSKMTLRMGKYSKTTMHLKVSRMRIMKGYLLCSMC